MQGLAKLCRASIQRSRRASKSWVLSSSCLRHYATGRPLPPQTELLDGNRQLSPEELEEFEDEEAAGEVVQDYPNLLQYHPYYDSFESHDLLPLKKVPHKSTITIRNEPPIFIERMEQDLEKLKIDEEEEVDMEGIDTSGSDQLESAQTVRLTPEEKQKLHKYELIGRPIVQQTGKGKKQRLAIYTVVGNGDGLVGLGLGKDEEYLRARNKSFNKALRSMDYVERFEKRTIFTEMYTKLGSTQIILRPRPVGFGLACNPYIHQILKAAGIKDCSAKVWGSRNKLNVMMALFRMLHAGNSPLSMGDGFGGGARKMDKGSGVVGRHDVERERGRKLVDLRTW